MSSLTHTYYILFTYRRHDRHICIANTTLTTRTILPRYLTEDMI